MREIRGISAGPWEVEPRPNPWFDLHIWGPGGRVIGEHIATVNTEANAALMAASRQMLDALENMRGAFDTPVERLRRPFDDFQEEAIQSMRDALEKAGRNIL